MGDRERERERERDSNFIQNFEYALYTIEPIGNITRITNKV
jgi:hypothetical protein